MAGSASSGKVEERFRTKEGLEWVESRGAGETLGEAALLMSSEAAGTLVSQEAHVHIRAVVMTLPRSDFGAIMDQAKYQLTFEILKKVRCP